MTDEDMAAPPSSAPSLRGLPRDVRAAARRWVWSTKRLRQQDPAHFQLASVPQLETWSASLRKGHYMGPLNLTWVAIGGGFDGPNPYNMMNFISRFRTAPA